MQEAALPHSSSLPLTRSLDRIEAALARIEAAAQARAQASTGATVPEPDQDADLEQRHTMLKAAVGQALARIDGLIERQS